MLKYYVLEILSWDFDGYFHMHGPPGNDLYIIFDSVLHCLISGPVSKWIQNSASIESKIIRFSHVFIESYI